jgi:hypothetical protein
MTATYALHPLAELVPPMTAEEFTEFKADIKAQGLREPITLYEGKILDGKHRYRACRELGIEIKTHVWRPQDGQPLDFIISENIRRRMLTTGQKAALALELRPAIERELAEGKPVPRGVHGLPPSRSASVLAAQKVGISRSSVDEYATLKQEAPDLAKQVRLGHIGITSATVERLARRPHPKPKPPTVADLSERARTAATAFTKSVAALTKARGDLTFMELWAIWAAIFEVQGYLERMARQHRLPVPETPADLKRLKARSQ